MKTKLFLLVIVGFLVMGTVNAASIWGTYKGNQIIRLTVDGKAAKVTDVPAISYQGRTMIPIYLLKDADINYTWDSKNQTVNIIKKKDNGISYNDLNDLKLYSMGTSTFYDLITVSMYFEFLNRDMLMTALGLPYKPDENLNATAKAIQNTENALNKVRTSSVSSIARLKNGGMPSAATQLSNAINKYSEALGLYKLAYENLLDYDTDSDYYSKYIANDAEAMMILNDVLGIIDSAIYAFQGLIADFEASSTTSSNSEVKPEVTSVQPSSTVSSKIDGTFEGFENGAIFKLWNGQIWEQTSYDYKYTYKYAPDVTIFQDGSIWYMIVDGVDGKIKVKKIK